MKVAAVVDPFHFAQGLFRMGVEIVPFAVERMGEQNLCGQTRLRNAGALQQFPSLCNGAANG
jgi:hypothetical protein